MPDKHKPRAGSMQYWPRKRASSPVARVRSWASGKNAQLLGFAGYKVGMTHVIAVDNRPKSLTKGEKISIPVSIIECPAIKIASIRVYKNGKVAGEYLAKNLDKELARKLSLSKKNAKVLDELNPDDFDELRANVYTQPKRTGIGKKKPEFFEMAVGGSKEDALNYLKENLGKEIDVADIFSEGQMVDVHSVTKGKGYQGPVKRFGISVKSIKSEKIKRAPGSIAGGWKAHGHMMYRVPDAGQTGFHTRTEHNKQILSINDNPELVNPQGGFVRYGLVKNKYLLVKGSVGGARKRLVRFCMPLRKKPQGAFDIVEISTKSKQG
ncbi:MAG: 50S ribosomal protein L3 [Candidatus Nanoarchaeia archaeon]